MCRLKHIQAYRKTVIIVNSYWYLDSVYKGKYKLQIIIIATGQSWSSCDTVIRNGHHFRWQFRGKDISFLQLSPQFLAPHIFSCISRHVFSQRHLDARKRCKWGKNGCNWGNWHVPIEFPSSSSCLTLLSPAYLSLITLLAPQYIHLPSYHLCCFLVTVFQPFFACPHLCSTNLRAACCVLSAFFLGLPASSLTDFFGLILL